MEHKEILNELKQGICEVTTIDEYSVENKISATMSPNHLPDETCDDTSVKNNQVLFWNVVEAQWQIINFGSIIDIERLTGVGCPANKNKLQSSSEYLFEFVEE
tara:strand:- start:727 stop:1035 length:309 start_codon:yes stop_codon:yes gene_type:complete